MSSSRTGRRRHRRTDRDAKVPSPLINNSAVYGGKVRRSVRKRNVTRRAFLGIMAGLGVATSVGCPPRTSKGVIAYKRSGRGLHVSQAAKKHNANHLYATFAAALSDVPHPGDHSKVVSVVISRCLRNKLFPNGKLVADLRHDL